MALSDKRQKLSHLRNAGLYLTRADAYASLKALADDTEHINDGEVVLARYGGSLADSKVLVGAYQKSGTTATVAILDSTDDIVLSGINNLTVTSSVTSGVTTWTIDPSALTAATLSSVSVNGQPATVDNHVASVSIDGAHVKVSSYTKPTTAYTAIATSDTITSALGKLEKRSDELNTAITTEITNRTNADTTIKTNVGLKSDGTYSANTDSQYISSATSVQDALIKLDEAIGGVSAETESEFTAVENEVVCIKAVIGIPSGETCVADAYDGKTYISSANNILDAVGSLDDAITNLSSKTSSMSMASVTKTAAAGNYITSVTTENGSVASVGTAALPTTTVGVSAAAGTGDILTSYTVTVNGTAAAATIDIPKDRTLVSVGLGHVNDAINPRNGTVTEGDGNISLNFVHYLSDGTYSLTPIDVSHFLADAQYGDGLAVTSGVVNIDIEAGSPLKFNDDKQLTIEDIDCGTYA